LGFIYWIASYPKSGNTWVRAFLTSLITNGARTDSGKLPEIIHDDNLARFYQPFLNKPVSAASNAELAMVRPRVHRALARKAQNFLLLKTHSMLGTHRGTPTVTFDVTAGALYLVRNPLDVAVSYGRHPHLSVDDAIAAMNQPQREAARVPDRSYELSGSWSENVISWTKPHDRVLVLRHEDVLVDPLVQFRRVAQLLKMDASDEQLKRALDDTRTLSGATGKWRKLLTEEQVAAVARAHQTVMKQFGYWQDEFDELVQRRPAVSGATLP